MTHSKTPDWGQYNQLDIARYQVLFRRHWDELAEKGANVLDSFQSDSFTACALLEDMRRVLPPEVQRIDPDSAPQFIRAMADCFRRRLRERRFERKQQTAYPVAVLPADQATQIRVLHESLKNPDAELEGIPIEDVIDACDQLEIEDAESAAVVNLILVLGADEQYLQKTQILPNDSGSERTDRIKRAISKFTDVLNGVTSLALPEIIDNRYQLIEAVGRGGFGEVWSAKDLVENREVAIKVPRPRSHQTKDFQDLKQEAEKLRAIQIIGVPRFYDLCSLQLTDGKQAVCLVFQYIRGQTLKKAAEERRVRQGPSSESRPDWQWIAETMANVAEILQELHHLRIWHWDLKPENILIDEQGKLWVVDFGLATHDSQRLYLPETWCAGTPHYMSPEQAAGGRNLDGMSDIWSLGVILYQLISGRLPFDQLTPLELCKAICDLNPSPPALQHSDIPKSLQDICLKCLNKHPARRYPSSKALAEALRNWNRPAPRPLPSPPLPADKVSQTQQEWKDYLKLPKRLVSYGNIALELIPPGAFKQGSPDNEGQPTERPQHDKWIDQPFLISTTCITQRQWRDEMKTEPWLDHGVPTGDDFPAVCISWDDAREFCSRLTARSEETWRLPTETEWEYACRAGTITKYSCDDADLPQYAWYKKTTIDEKLRPVATKLPNPFGLFDMHGGVWEWCVDNYRQNYDSATIAADNFKVCRGGSTRVSEESIRSAVRLGAEAGKRHKIHGFRVVRELRQGQPFITQQVRPASRSETVSHDR